MKQTLTYTLMAICTMFVMTSCDSDTDLAYDLDGVWSGTLSSEFYDYRYGQHMTDTYETEITFVQEGDFSRGGTGYEIDYNLNTGRSSQTYFDWTVRGGKIYIDYDDHTTVVVRDYDIYTVGRTPHFRGYFDDYYDGSTLAAFNLVKVTRTRAAGDRQFIMVPKDEFK